MTTMMRKLVRRWFGKGSLEVVAERWVLGKDETARLPRLRGPTLIRVERGLLLVTREGDPEDHVLKAGEELRLPRQGRVAAWALEPSVAAVARVPAAGRPGHLRPLHAEA